MHSTSDWRYILPMYFDISSINHISDKSHFGIHYNQRKFTCLGKSAMFNQSKLEDVECVFAFHRKLLTLRTFFSDFNHR